MKLLPREIIVSLIMFIICSLRVYRAMDCGGNQVSSTLIVDKFGQSGFKTIQAAIDSVYTNNNKWVKIYIKAGTYIEKVQIPYDKSCIFLEGEGRQVNITYNDHQRTDLSATFSSFASNVVALGIAFENSFDFGVRIPALAARIYGDKSAFFHCRFTGFQDTLWDVEGRHYFKNSLIQGAVDFIFGNGQSYFEDCVLHVSSLGSITAQGRNSSNDPNGFVFEGGYVVGSGSTILGRAYGPCSRVIFYKTYLAPIVDPQGWDSWNYTNQDCIFYAEIGCKGPGANTSKRVPWLRKNVDVRPFLREAFINQDGWLQDLPLITM